MSWVGCVCDVIGNACGTATLCGVPGVIDAIEKKDWAKVASLLISGGSCQLAAVAIVAAAVAGAIQCSLSSEDVAADSAGFNQRLAEAIKNEIARIDFSEVAKLLDAKPGKE
jgi:hypothetical protein